MPHVDSQKLTSSKYMNERVNELLKSRFVLMAMNIEHIRVGE